jgi:2-hydroxy-3-keto-5-methylthiopentenyl-1-phosphate phosphatase
VEEPYELGFEKYNQSHCTYCKTTTLQKQKYTKINLFCIGLSISYLWESKMGKYIPNKASKIAECTEKNY